MKIKWGKDIVILDMPSGTNLLFIKDISGSPFVCDLYTWSLFISDHK